MKTKIKITLVLTAAILSSAACKKTLVNAQLDGGAINVTNAVVGAPTLTIMNEPSVISAANNSISANNYAFLPISSGQTVVKVGIPPVDATATAAAVPAVVYFNQTLSVDKTTNYSLFLTGASVNAIDNVLIKETYTRTYADSVCAVRFINLAQGNTAVSVNLQGSPSGSEVQSIAYKAYSNFIQHPAKRMNPNYVFEFRNATTGALITTYTLTTPYFHNVTLALRGTIGGSTGVILDNDY